MIKISSISGNNIYVVGTDCISQEQIILTRYDVDGRIFVKKTNINGLFICEQKLLSIDKFNVSSACPVSSAVVNDVFGTNFVDVYYKQQNTSSYRKVAIDRACLEKLIIDTDTLIDLDLHVAEEDDKYSSKKKNS